MSEEAVSSKRVKVMCSTHNDEQRPWATMTIFYTGAKEETSTVLEADQLAVKIAGTMPRSSGFQDGARFLEWRCLDPMTAADIAKDVVELPDVVANGQLEDVTLVWRAEMTITKPCDADFWAEKHLTNEALANLRRPPAAVVDLNLPSVG